MEKKFRLLCVRDPVHDYIYFTESTSGEVAEKDIINSKWVQRLRRIFQLQSSWLVYPGATHTRFQHSLGVMQLAGNLAKKLYDKFKKVFPDEEIPEKNYVEEVFRLAGLLHDIGHGPFGHLLDDVYTYKRFGLTHEDITCRIIEKELADLIKEIHYSPNGEFKKTILPEQLIKFIKVPLSFEGYKLWEQIFSKIMLGVYSVDIIDFLLRDKYFCGTKEFGSVDMMRLLDQTTITKSGFSLKKNAIPAFKGFLFTRMSMFRHIYFHEKKELFETSFGMFLPKVLEFFKLGDIRKSLKKYYYLDDFSLNSILVRWKREEKGEKRKLGKLWENILVHRDTPLVPVLSGEKIYNKYVKKEELIKPEEIEKDFLNRIKIKCPVFVRVNVVDVRLQNQFVKFNTKEELMKYDTIKSISVYDEEKGSVVDEKYNQILQDIPVKYLTWIIFVPKKYASKVKSILETEIELVDSQLSLPLKGERWDETKDRTEITNA